MGIELRVIRLCRKHLYLLSHLASPLNFEFYFTVAQGMELKCSMYARAGALLLSPVPSSKSLTLMFIVILR